ncbi:MAG TPA: DUF5682 family protein [Ktedonobacterales bacterium]|jgi:hypothetical protein
MSVHLFGVRHHGPGCARSLRAALERLAPDIVLVEGPPDAHDALPLMREATMRPPVALLIYAPDAPGQAVYYPFARFSPEWQALDYALGAGVPARFIDLPIAVRFAQAPQEPAKSPGAVPDAEPDAEPDAALDAEPDDETAGERADEQAEEQAAALRRDPLAMLAQAAGYDDHELWWERQIEQRRDLVGFFEGILEAMTAMRAGDPPASAEEAQREAQMRQNIRAAQREGYQRIAVVTGAWHSPALVALDDARGDTALLAKLKRAKVAATWIPWTNARLAYRSGYGAGVSSPGWYEHLWEQPDGAPARWLARAARLLRESGLDTSSANVIEATRLSEALAALRDLPMPGLAELREATQAVLCNGDATRMQVIHDRLEVGIEMGAVPPETPTTPLQRDLEALQRRLRLPASGEIRQLDLDLRDTSARMRSHLLRRLGLLGIPWGEQRGDAGGVKGTFHELWQIQWQVEFPILLIEANVWGNTVAQASAAKAIAQMDKATDLATLTTLLDATLLAGLPNATAHALAATRARAAVTSDARLLLDALPPLARVARYGDVRGSRAADVAPVYASLFERALIGLPGACASLDDDAATAMVRSIERGAESVGLLDNADQRAEWIAALRGLIDLEHAHGLVRGRCCRLLLDMRALSGEELARRARLALSPVNPAEQAAAWVEGALMGGAVTLIRQDALWQALDAWLCELSAEEFIATLPLIRRSFARFDSAERRAMGEKVRALRGVSGGGAVGAAASADDAHIDPERAALTLPTLARLLAGGAGATSETGEIGGAR